MASRYRTNSPSQIAPVQLVSGLGYIYVFRQSYSHTLLVDRFVLDGLGNTLNRKLEVRFKRSKQRYKPSQTQKKEASRLTNIDSLDFKDINGNEFYEPTTILNIIPGCVDDGLFSVVLLPTSEQDKYRWHIFSYNSQNQKVELTTIPGSDDGLFDLKDYTVLDPESRSIPGIIQRTLDLGNITVAKGLTATKYDLQRERQTDDGMQLLKESVRILLAVGTSEGNVATISFAAADGTLSQIKDKPDSTTILHSTTRQILLPLDTLEQIKALSNSNPPPQGMIAHIARGEEDGVVLTSDKATGLDEAKITQVKVEGNQDYNRLYSQVTKIDDNTFEITPETTNGGTWEVIPEEEAGLIYNGIVTAYEITKTGKLKVTAFNHGLTNGDSVQIVDAQDYNGTYTVTKVDSKTFSLDGVKWQAGTAISAKLQSPKRRGVIFDGVGDYIELPLSGKVLSSDFTVEAWIKPSALGGTDVLNSILGTDRNSKNQGLQLIVRGQTPHFGFYGNDTFDQI